MKNDKRIMIGSGEHATFVSLNDANNKIDKRIEKIDKIPIKEKVKSKILTLNRK